MTSIKEDKELQTRILGQDYGSYLFVDKFSEGEVWINAHVQGGSTHLVLSNEQAKDMIAALIRIVEAE